VAEPARLPPAMGSRALPEVRLRAPSRRLSARRDVASRPSGATSRHDHFENDPQRVGPRLALAEADPRACPERTEGVGPTPSIARNQEPSLKQSGGAEPSALYAEASPAPRALSRRILSAGRFVVKGLLKIVSYRGPAVSEDEKESGGLEESV